MSTSTHTRRPTAPAVARSLVAVSGIREGSLNLSGFRTPPAAEIASASQSARGDSPRRNAILAAASEPVGTRGTAASETARVGARLYTLRWTLRGAAFAATVLAASSWDARCAFDARAAVEAAYFGAAPELVSVSLATVEA